LRPVEVVSDRLAILLVLVEPDQWTCIGSEDCLRLRTQCAERRAVPRTNPPYPPEFRTEAIRLVRASDEEHPIPRIAREIGVSYGTLRSWLNQDEIDSGEREGLNTEEKEELQRLRREVKTLRQEKKVSRKAAAFFARGDRGSVSAFRLIDLRRGPATRWRCSMQDARSLQERLLRLAQQAALREEATLRIMPEKSYAWQGGQIISIHRVAQRTCPKSPDSLRTGASKVHETARRSPLSPFWGQKWRLQRLLQSLFEQFQKGSSRLLSNYESVKKRTRR
jgi:transposase